MKMFTYIENDAWICENMKLISSVENGGVLERWGILESGGLLEGAGLLESGEKAYWRVHGGLLKVGDLLEMEGLLEIEGLLESGGLLESAWGLTGVYMMVY